MASEAPNSQYSYSRDYPQSATSQSHNMDSQSTKGKDPATSVYPSPADEPTGTFSAPSSPVFSERVGVQPFHGGRPTLPPIDSVVHQMPSPSSSPRMPLASYNRISAPFLPASFNSSQDDTLFPDRPFPSGHVSMPQPLFINGPSIVQDKLSALSEHFQQQQQREFIPSIGLGQETLDAAKISRQQRLRLPLPQTQPQFPPGRQRKRPADPMAEYMRRPLSPGTEMYGRNDLWARQISDPERYVLPVIAEWSETFKAVRATLPAPTFPIQTPPGMLESLAKLSPQDAAEYSRRHATTAVGKRGEKRKADTSTDMPPPRRTRKLSPSTTSSSKPSASPREAPLEMPEKKFRRRTNEANKAKASSEKIARDYTIYPDYCPPLSTLDGDHVTFPNIEWKATPQDVSGYDDCHLLHPKEIAIVSKLVLTPSDYVYIKRRFFAHRLESAKRGHIFNINAAQLACKGLDEHGITGIDVNKTSRLHKAFDKVGWLDERHMKRFL
jgi:hypothetical protein